MKNNSGNVFAALALLCAMTAPMQTSADVTDYDNLLLDDGGHGLDQEPFLRFDWYTGEYSSWIWARHTHNLEFAHNAKRFLSIEDDILANGYFVLGPGGLTMGANSDSYLASLLLQSNGNNYPRAKAIVDNSLLTEVNREMLLLSNNGTVQFVLENTDTSTSWITSTTNSDHYLFSLEGTGGPEVRIKPAGAMTAGPGGEAAFELKPNGNLFLAGKLIEMSDEHSKENFHAVDEDGILLKISDLPLASWNYKHDSDAVRHVGPVAQDFHATFGFGIDNKTISPSDKIGVSLAAIKALNRQLEAEFEIKEAEIQKLTSEAESFDQRLARLEEVIRQLSPARQ